MKGVNILNTNCFNPSFEHALELDKRDDLSKFRNEFYIPEDKLYLDGNSLGLMSKRSEKSLVELMESWRYSQIEGWTDGKYPWFYLSEKLGKKMAPIVGAHPTEVIVTGSASANIHQVVSTFYQPKGNRTKIIATALDFPTDIYALQSQLRLHGYNPDGHLIRLESRDGRLIEEEDVIAAMTEEVALILLPTVLYRSGQLLNIKKLTEEAHKRGIIIGFDACHSAGVIPHSFSEWDVDFGIWCNYKYLNAGPGSVGSIYVNKKHFGKLPGLTGWYSSNKEKQFDMEHDLTPEHSASAYQIGTPHIFSLAPLIGSLEIFSEASIDRIYQKSRQITRYMMDLITSELDNMGFIIANPHDDSRRGGHVSLEHKEAVRICKALKENNITPDFRAPNIIRLAPIALYTSYEDVWHAINTLKKIMVEKQYEKFDSQRNVVA